MNSPKISVLMPVYNAEEYLFKAVNSVLNQTFEEFEYLIINDGSTDNSLSILQNIKDKRIRVILNDENKGIVYSLNSGIKLAKGKYIVRMDSDDYSRVDRLVKQYDFMENNPDIGICGTWVKKTGLSDLLWKPPLSHLDILAFLPFKTPFAHPSVIMRRQVILEHNLFYNENYIFAEDYELWLRASNVIKLANQPEVLLYYNTAKRSAEYMKTQDRQANRVRIKALSSLIQLSEKQKKYYFILFEQEHQLGFVDNLSSFLLLRHIIKRNNYAQVYPINGFRLNALLMYLKASRNMVSKSFSYFLISFFYPFVFFKILIKKYYESYK